MPHAMAAARRRVFRIAPPEFHADPHRRGDDYWKLRETEGALCNSCSLFSPLPKTGAIHVPASGDASGSAELLAGKAGQHCAP
ncbi:hypothetical protein [Sphingomonas fennica]|uniref:hypothetical protein n=1 Tax=Edaphosphingomonas fennica TaxID=114404 RepID=UPI001473A47A|nr:hypothetical protein [Sphingomonas fennica]